MSISNPQIANELIRIENFDLYAQHFLSEETQIMGIESSGARIEGTDYFEIEIQKSVFRNCTLLNCSFKNGSFTDVVFDSCDLSSSMFTGAFFERCRFVSCKCMGIDMSNTVIRQTTFEKSNFQYANFDRVKITDVMFEQIDFTEASMSEAALKKFQASGCKFLKNNFFRTMLATVDFSNNEFAAPVISTQFDELKGAVVNMYQAAELLSLWGVIVNK